MGTNNFMMSSGVQVSGVTGTSAGCKLIAWNVQSVCWQSERHHVLCHLPSLHFPERSGNFWPRCSGTILHVCRRSLVQYMTHAHTLSHAWAPTHTHTHTCTHRTHRQGYGPVLYKVPVCLSTCRDPCRGILSHSYVSCPLQRGVQQPLRSGGGHHVPPLITC
jgi:hypothetical protein